jgi:hypothetical protein
VELIIYAHGNKGRIAQTHIGGWLLAEKNHNGLYSKRYNPHVRGCKLVCYRSRISQNINPNTRRSRLNKGKNGIRWHNMKLEN